MAEVVAQSGALGSGEDERFDSRAYLVLEAPDVAVIVTLTGRMVSRRAHPAFLTKWGCWEDVTDEAGAAEALKIYAEVPPEYSEPPHYPGP